MTRGVVAAALVLLSLIVVLPASADGGRVARGSIVALTSRSISVQTDRVKVTCAVRAQSPSLDGYAAGDRVAIVCRKVWRDRFVLARIRHLEASTNADGERKTVTFGGAITALSDTSISLHDGDRDLTCAITSSSPSLEHAKVGDHVRVTCTNGVLTSVAPVTVPPAKPVEPPRPAEPPKPPTTTTHALTGAIGTIAVLGDTSLTVHNIEHDLTCSLGDGSPKLGDFQVGDHVKVLCTDGVLSSIARVQ
jgi:hypothetical protein